MYGRFQAVPGFYAVHLRIAEIALADVLPSRRPVQLRSAYVRRIAADGSAAAVEGDRCEQVVGIVEHVVRAACAQDRARGRIRVVELLAV